MALSHIKECRHLAECSQDAVSEASVSTRSRSSSHSKPLVATRWGVYPIDLACNESMPNMPRVRRGSRELADFEVQPFCAPIPAARRGYPKLADFEVESFCAPVPAAAADPNVVTLSHFAPLNRLQSPYPADAAVKVQLAMPSVAPQPTRDFAMGQRMMPCVGDFMPSGLAARGGMAWDPCQDAARPKEEQPETPPRSLSEILRLFAGVDTNCILVIRKTYKLGMNAESEVHEYLSQFGNVVRVLLSHSAVSKTTQKRRRSPSGLGFAQMQSVQDASRVLANGSEHCIGGFVVSVQHFEARPAPPRSERYRRF